MSRIGSLYIEEDSLIHKIDGSIKFILLLVWIICVFLFNDLRIFTGFFILGCLLLKLSKIPFSSIKPLFIFIIIFTLMNSLFLILITPNYGSELIDKYTVFFKIGKYSLTYETIWFAITLSMKYLALFPVMILFIFTTHPSKFASSLNKIGVSYKIAYAINITLRYIPDIKEEFKNIMHAQEARGVAFRKGDANIFVRLKNFNTILLPLVLSSLNKVDIISNAMDLRGFGKKNKRTWYSSEQYGVTDVLAILLIISLLVISILLKIYYYNRFWYPF